VISLNIQNILFALKENAIHQSSKPENPSTESIPPRFGLPTNNPHRHQSAKRGSMSSPAHRRQQEQRLIDYAPQDLSHTPRAVLALGTQSPILSKVEVRVIIQLHLKDKHKNVTNPISIARKVNTKNCIKASNSK
jgi:hypothetical protein